MEHNIVEKLKGRGIELSRHRFWDVFWEFYGDPTTEKILHVGKMGKDKVYNIGVLTEVSEGEIKWQNVGIFELPPSFIRTVPSILTSYYYVPKEDTGTLRYIKESEGEVVSGNEAIDKILTSYLN